MVCGLGLRNYCLERQLLVSLTNSLLAAEKQRNQRTRHGLGVIARLSCEKGRTNEAEVTTFMKADRTRTSPEHGSLMPSTLYPQVSLSGLQMR